MLQVLLRPLPVRASFRISASCVHLSKPFLLAPANFTMDRLRQRKPVAEKAITRSRTFEKRALTVQSTPVVTAEPATKKRKRALSKRKAKGLDDSAKEGSTAAASQTVQSNSSADTTYDAAPAISPAPSGVPTSTPADISRDPNVLHCWTKQSMADAATQLAQRDAALAPFIHEHGVPDRLLAKGFTNMFNSLARSILGQQLAVKAASVIIGRFMALCQCTDYVTPEAVLKLDQEQLRGVGLSYAKANYVLDLARHFQSGQLSDAKIAVMDDDTLVEELTKVKGIGRWTVDMFAMFHLGRPDVFPLGDLAVRKGLQELYKLKGKPTVAEMDVIGDVWRPYRSLGCYYMWRVPTSTQKSIKKKSVSTAAATADVTPAI